MYQKRAIEEVLKKLVKQFPIVLLTGPRQVGKTTTLKELFQQDYTFITMDDIVLRREIASDPGLFLKNSKMPLIIDEIQYVPEIFPYLKKKVDSTQVEGQFLLTGSQAFSLMQGVSESLAGRVGILELQGISLREKYEISFGKPFIPNREYIEKRAEQVVEYLDLWRDIHRGYMPRLTFREEIDWEIYYSSYVQTYIERDIRNLTQVADENIFLKFMISLAARTGELLNYASIAKDIGISTDTVRRWTSLLESSRIIYLLYPYSNNHLKRAIKTPKVYFLDTGLAAYLTKWLTSETLQNGAVAGNFFESFIISEIIKSFFNAGKTNLPLYYYRDKDGKEIDLIIEQGDEIYPIEIKMSAAPNQSMAKHFSVLDRLADKKVQTGTILCQYERPLWLKEDLVALPIEYL